MSGMSVLEELEATPIARPYSPSWNSLQERPFNLLQAVWDEYRKQVLDPTATQQSKASFGRHSPA